MTERSIREYAMALRGRYQAAGKEAKGRMLDEFCQVTGYHRKAAVRLLGAAPTASGQECRSGRRGRPQQYGPAVRAALVQVWEAADRPCGKRLAPFLTDLVPHLERHGELTVPPAVRAQLLTLSAATIDRLLQAHRLGMGRRPFAASSSSGVLKAQIPVRTWGEWAEVTPGSVQADLVLHCGESTAGFYLTTLVAVDVATSWCELEAVWGKGQQRVGTGVHHIRERFPIPLRELHTDNGGEFINDLLYPWCRREGIRFTRGRPYKKNDQAYGEQKNWTAVRRLIGYDRYSSQAAYAQLGRLLPLIADYLNFFQPVRKLVRKERSGAKVAKRYDRAQTPYQRLLAAGVLNAQQAYDLAARYHRLNPVALRTQIDAELTRLWKLADHGAATATE